LDFKLPNKGITTMMDIATENLVDNINSEQEDTADLNP
jgi:hypothetical protein